MPPKAGEGSSLLPPRAPQGTGGTLADGGSPGAECSSVTAEMRETWMLLEYCDRGNLDRAILNRVFIRNGKPHLVRPARSPALQLRLRCG